jgi:hypothetical protein
MMPKKQQHKGPRKYEHGKDSTFILSALSVHGQWISIFSRSRPGSRANKVFTQDEQLSHLRRGFSEKAKGFDMFGGDFLFAYIGLNAEGQTWKNAIHSWTAASGWKSGAPESHPAISSTPVWQFGPHGSTLFLHVRNAAGWSPKIWGWDRPGSNSLIVFPLEEQIKRLQVQFQNGGHEKNRFNPAEIIQAHIARREGGSIQNALCYYTPETGWQQGTKPYQSPDKPVDLPEMSGKLWVTGPNMKAETIRPNNFLRRQFQVFCSDFPNQWPTAVQRYCDPETGEIPMGVIEAFFWAQEAKIKKANSPAVNMARIYFGDKPQYLIARLDTGQIYDPRCYSWPSPDYFTR